MIAALAPSLLIERLPAVRGRLVTNAPLGPQTWFRVGGSADALFRPADVDDLSAFLAARPADVPVTVLGVASNTLVRDGGIAGVVIRLGRGFTGVSVEGDVVTAGAGVLCANVARAAADAGLEGLEFLSGVPGTLGGALVMNAGAYGGEIRDILLDADLVDERGGRRSLTNDALGYGYRHSRVPDGWIFLGARLRGRPGDARGARARMAEVQAAREASQPLRTRTGGSTFKNPPGEKAWQLVDRAGCRGLRVGGAVMSEKHCNFMVAGEGATAADLETLGEEVRRRVRELTGIELEWEIRRMGRPAAGGAS